MAIVITAFEQSPDRGRGLARDMRVRWALEEVGQPYEVRLLSFEAMKYASHLALQPFGQIPTYEDGEVVLFESGAIVQHIADRFEGLMPRETLARGRAVSWLFAALNSVEPPILELANARLLEMARPGMLRACRSWKSGSPFGCNSFPMPSKARTGWMATSVLVI